MKAFAKLSDSTDDIVLTDVSRPDIDEHELLVRVSASGVGVHDEYFLPPNPEYPYVIGIEAAGTIEEIGSAVTDYTPGRRITFINPMQRKGGTWAEFTVVPDQAFILSIPENMKFEKAAAVPVAGSTALKALHALDLKLEIASSLPEAPARSALG